RPVPLPSGPVERWADIAGAASVAGFTTAALVSGDVRRAADLTASSVPKAARLGREAFAQEVALTLSKRDVVVLNPSALRVLDRVNTVLIDAELLAEEVGALEAVGHVEGEDDPVLGAAATAMLERRDRAGTARRDENRLEPAERLLATVSWPAGARARYRELNGAGGTVLGFVEGDRLKA